MVITFLLAGLDRKSHEMWDRGGKKVVLWNPVALGLDLAWLSRDGNSVYS